MNRNERAYLIYWLAVLILSIFMAVACSKQPEPEQCYECTYHDQVLTFCMTEREMDSICEVFNTGCERDSMKCKPKY